MRATGERIVSTGNLTVSTKGLQEAGYKGTPQRTRKAV